jgi:hypothetical protein
MLLEQLHTSDYTANLHPNGGWISSTQSGEKMEALPMISICGSADDLVMRLEQLHSIDYTANLHPNGG